MRDSSLSKQQQIGVVGEWYADTPWSKQQQSGVASGMRIRHGQVKAEAEKCGQWHANSSWSKMQRSNSSN